MSIIMYYLKYNTIWRKLELMRVILNTTLVSWTLYNTEVREKSCKERESGIYAGRAIERSLLDYSSFKISTQNTSLVSTICTFSSWNKGADVSETY